MLLVDVVSKETGEVYRSFDMPYSYEGKRYINSWIKVNGYKFDHVTYESNGTTVWVTEKGEQA